MQTVHTECPYVRENAQESVLVLLLLFTFRAGIGRFLSLLTCLSTFSPFPRFLHPSLTSYTLPSLPTPFPRFLHPSLTSYTFPSLPTPFPHFLHLSLTSYTFHSLPTPFTHSLLPSLICTFSLSLIPSPSSLSLQACYSPKSSVSSSKYSPPTQPVWCRPSLLSLCLALRSELLQWRRK
jgi:hypothetical protein